MQFIFSNCRGKRTALIPPEEILKNIALSKKGNVIVRYEITGKQLETHMKNLVLDGYLDYSASGDKEGNMQYVVTLTTRGEAFRREHDDRIKRRWQSIGWKVLLTTIGVIFGFAITRLLQL